MVSQHKYHYDTYTNSRWQKNELTTALPPKLEFLCRIVVNSENIIFLKKPGKTGSCGILQESGKCGFSLPYHEASG